MSLLSFTYHNHQGCRNKISGLGGKKERNLLVVVPGATVTFSPLTPSQDQINFKHLYFFYFKTQIYIKKNFKLNN